MGASHQTPQNLAPATTQEGAVNPYSIDMTKKSAA